MNFLVLNNPNEFVKHINYAHNILNSQYCRLDYSLNLRSESGFGSHETKMNYLKQYIFIPEVKCLIESTEKRVNEFLSKKSIDSGFD